ncbi:MAG: hypothetical protein M3322_07910 [Actinomycetota bacterium]|nr:hypothetical protein [Actinomycetota bacterium]
MMMTTVAEQAFAPPGPGVWMLDATHWTRPLTRFQMELFPEPFRRGFGESLRRYGSLLEYLDVGFANGFPSYRPRPVAAPEHAGRIRRARSGTSSQPATPRSGSDWRRARASSSGSCGGRIWSAGTAR